MVVNNNAAAVLLVLATLAAGRDVLVSRGESVEIGGGFRIPEVLEASGARLVDVGTTNRTRLGDYRKAMSRGDVAAVLKVHPSNFRVEGFTETTGIAELATLDVPVVADIGSGLVDAGCPWIGGPPPAWLGGEPAARQTLAEGAALVTFSGDKLFGGPQAGVLAGRAELVQRCRSHPLARALRPGGHVLRAMQAVTLSYLRRTATTELPFWRMATAPVATLRSRAEAIAPVYAEPMDAVVGAGSAPGATIASYGLALPGDRLAALRAHEPPIIARTRDGHTLLDLRTVDPSDDATLAAAVGA
jgi:L-seryl-tRNA(Ser) seleniumtransferase